MNIPFFPYSKLYESHKKDFIDIFDDVCSRGAFILQKDLEEFEKNISEFLRFLSNNEVEFRNNDLRSSDDFYHLARNVEADEI